MTISITGLGTSLDLDKLVDALLQVEKAKVTTLETKQSTFQKELNSWTGIKTKLTGFLEAVEELRSPDLFKSKTMKSSSESVATASATSSAASGTYHLHVTSVATSTAARSSDRMGNMVDPDAALKDSGLALTVTAGSISVNGTSIEIDPTTDTLNTVLAKINTAVPDVSASFDSGTGKVTFAYTGGGSGGVQLGSGSDTSNFFAAIGVDGQTGTTITSSTTLGSVNTTAKLSSANFKTGLDASGEFEINGVKIAYDASTDSLSDIIGRINNSDAQVTATYDATEDKLVFTAQYTGSKTIQMADVSGNFLTAAGLSGATQTLGENAVYSIDEINGGGTLYSSSNDISTVIPGVSLTLKEAGDTTITVADDTEAVFTAITAFVTQYNNTISGIASATEKDALLQGDSTANRLKAHLRQYTTNTVEDVSGGLNLASKIGISVGKDGTMILDENKLKEVLATNSGAVYDLFNTTDGIATRLTKEIDIWLDDASGIIPSKETSLNDKIDDLDTDIEKLNDRLEMKKQRLESRFNQMDSKVSALESQLDTVLSLIESMKSDKD